MYKDASSTRRKRVIRTDSNLPPYKKIKFANKSFVVGDGVDRISHLPVEVRIHILSLLSLKEAARTSVLSFSWLNLWKHTPSLHFEADIESDVSWNELIDSAGPKYVKMVNRVVESHKSLAIKEFKINFPLDASYANSPITRWLEFAFSRHVQRLELHLDDPEFRNYDTCSCFPEQLLARSNMILDFQSLKELSFKNVQLSGGAI
ncbi:PREDICTED: F-box/LRR-repeat protein At3g26922-like [Erythranthe guttata]|uniref:F-box/LRR-repeat protein At3g26922-like n=1 Tax=Erythranthe guttata TaxID=4155 RepID=UPI00064D8FBC|nr:PREDICTED: F-box/LRR-repeat protein At3g26922-like [Erythranthe guttata]|eukprot:XP_012851149.1 PREDICTED: F-box/LRR-repeat protein At3g26922-like [Erythranthe guttata]